ncbi:uncharacterized protein Dsimw501_GD27041, isoform D [Drosophila simulans]|uniref:Uncharacterized protein, isoform D n=1 Tax=Drosophila simulans TaxID=7240 RepID=A0A0J9UNN3_DROSI|nr:uncharacterized protein Dsimw501_GD27041, isoform D [Drosophila simulans]
MRRIRHGHRQATLKLFPLVIRDGSPAHPSAVVHGTPRYECFPLWPSVKLSAHMINICGQRHCSTMHSYSANSIWLLSWPSAIFSLINRVVWLLTFNCEFHTETHKRLFLEVFLAIKSIDVFGISNFYDVLERIGNVQRKLTDIATCICPVKSPFQNKNIHNHLPQQGH